MDLELVKWFDEEFEASAGPANYLVSSSAGAYVYAGQAATVKHNWFLSLAAGSYTYTGQSATINKSRIVVAAAGSYSIAGQAAGLLHSRLVTAGAGAYAYSGQPANLLIGKAINAAAGSYAITGHSATITYTQNGAYTIAATDGAYSISGQDAQIVYTPNAPAATPSSPFGGISGLYAGPTVGESKKRKPKKFGPVMREGQVFGEQYPVSPNVGVSPPPAQKPSLRATGTARKAVQMGLPLATSTPAQRASRAKAMLHLFMQM